MIICVIGVSGSGKTTLVNEAEKKLDIPRVITCTTRKPRAGEKDGTDYIFMSEAEFSETKLAEKDRYHGHGYGTPCWSIENALNEAKKHGRNSAFVITTAKGFENISKLYKSTGIVVETDLSVIEQRMRNRGDSKKSIASRLSGIREEAARNRCLFDCIHMETSGNLDRDIKSFCKIVSSIDKSIEKEREK